MWIDADVKEGGGEPGDIHVDVTILFLIVSE